MKTASASPPPQPRCGCSDDESRCGLPSHLELFTFLSSLTGLIENDTVVMNAFFFAYNLSNNPSVLVIV